MKKVLVFVIAFLVVVFVCLLVLKINQNKEEKNYKEENNIDINENIENIEESNNKNESGSESYNMKFVINDKEYIVNLEHNETVKALIDILPLDIKMSELNSNEKYFYLDKSLPTNSSVPKKIEKGDIMLYGDNCLVLFYKSFTTNYSYTKIGHIDNLLDLGNSDINVKVFK